MNFVLFIQFLLPKTGSKVGAQLSHIISLPENFTDRGAQSSIAHLNYTIQI